MKVYHHAGYLGRLMSKKLKTATFVAYFAKSNMLGWVGMCCNIYDKHLPIW